MCARIVPWDMPEVYRVVSTVAALWLKEMGKDRSDLERALTHARDTLPACGARIQPDCKGTRPPPGVHNRIGWRYEDSRGDWWYLLRLSGRWAGLKKEFTWLENEGADQAISRSRVRNRRAGVLQRRF